MSNVEEFPSSARRLSEYEALLFAAPGLLEAIPGAVYICDLRGRLTRYNAEAERLWGRSPRLNDAGQLYCGSYRLIQPDGATLPHADCPMAHAIRSGLETRNAEIIMERIDGGRFTALVNIRPLKDQQGAIQGAINCFQDISAIKIMEEEVRQKRGDLEDFFENSAIGLHIVSGDGIIRRANKAELTLLGYTEEQYVGRHIAEFHADAPVIGDILHRLSIGESLERYPARLRAKDGSIKHVLITSNSRFSDGRFVNTRCFTTDVTDLVEAEGARRESESRLAATYQAATVGIAEVDRHGRMTNVNNAFCEILGQTREALLAMSFLDYTHEEDRERDAASYARQVRGELDGYSIRKRAVKADGTLVYLDVYSSSVRDEGGCFQHGVRIVQDVSDAKRMEDKIRQSEQHMRTLLEALPAAVYTTDADGNITFFNKAAVEMAGRTPKVGDKWCVTWKLYTADGAPLPHDQCPMAVALKENRAVRGVEAIAERPDGTRIPFIPFPTPLRDPQGSLVGAVNMLVDLTERKRAEAYAARLAAIVEFSDDAIISQDRDGVIRTWNNGARMLFGHEEHEVIGRPITLVMPVDRHDEGAEILARIRGGEHVSQLETVRLHKSGEALDVSLTVSPLRDAHGAVIGASEISRDITERRRQEERRQLLINELNHRVKNTLATVQSLSAQSFRGENRTLAYCDFEGRLIALSRAHDLLNQESWGEVDLEELIHRTLAPICVEPALRFRITGAPVRVQPELALSLSMAFHELCTNAIKYGALATAAGKIQVEWNRLTLKDAQYLSLRWKEVDGPRVSPPTKKGFGSRLLERALSPELDAQVGLRFPETGVECEFRVRLP